MNGYIIVALNEESGKPEKFWNGVTFDENIETAQFVAERIDARTSAGTIQSRNTTLDIRVVPAQLTIAIGHAPTEPEPTSTAA